MNKVFIGGSRRISRLNQKVTKSLDKFIHSEYTLLIGDANGADKAVQSYLANISYTNVIVYCMKNGCRNNLGNWKTKVIKAPSAVTGFEYYVLKDAAMINDTDYGFLLWDLKSKGTLNNIINLLKAHKTAVVYLSTTKTLHELSTISDIVPLLTRCNNVVLEKLVKDLKVSQLQLQI